MRLVAQRVREAKVTINGDLFSEIATGVLVFLAIAATDSGAEADFLIRRLLNAGFFEDDNGKLSRSILETQTEILVVSQFTLYARLDKGKKPDFSLAAPPAIAEKIYNEFIEKLQSQYSKVKTGHFAAMMDVTLVNDGPVTFILDK